MAIYHRPTTFTITLPGSHPLRVRRAVAELNNGQREIKAPKSAAGKRTVSIPAAIIPDLREHLKRYAEPGADGRVFIGANGRPRAASTGASTRELMARMGHSAARAALIYQHASVERDRVISDAVSGLVDKGRKKKRKPKKKQDPEPKGHAGDTAD